MKRAAVPVLHGLGLAVVWAAVAVMAGIGFFLNSEREAVVAGHDTVIRPTLGGYVEVHSGPVLPDLRVDSGRRIGVDVTLGKTNSDTLSELVDRYALIASQPEGSIARVEAAVGDMATDAAVRGMVVGLVPVAFWLLLGRTRRRELWRAARTPSGVAVIAVAVVTGVLAWEPWEGDEEAIRDEQSWVTLPEYLAGAVAVPEAVAGVEVRTDTGAIDSRRLIESAVSTYDRSKEFYDEAAAAAEDLVLREPEEDETVALVVSDRHDNIGMDRVARAIGDRAGATVVMDAGDDTSTGEAWEAFSLDSVTAAFDGYDKLVATGNHDGGGFVADYLGELGWTVLDGDVEEGPGGGTLVGAPDPRSSGLGNWRDETGLSFAEVGELLSEELCTADERINTVLVHDANLATDALARGCVDLVVGGHVHVKIGPDRIDGENGAVGYKYTTGTTGGAAYAIAIGSKPRRDAMVSLITYRDGAPVAIQAVTLQTNGTFEVGDYVEIAPGEPDPESDSGTDSEPEGAGLVTRPGSARR
ncbi:metallophosphoesterase [Nocardioides sp.]|uniref:metallophosphoesterase n=1 Tax=Nocardioides sp. TaxID=35761 RepID=UPI002ED5F070